MYVCIYVYFNEWRYVCMYYVNMILEQQMDVYMYVFMYGLMHICMYI